MQIFTVPFRSPLAQAGLQPRACPCICDSSSPACVGRWRISEINTWPVPIFSKRRDVEPLLCFPEALQDPADCSSLFRRRAPHDTLRPRTRSGSEAALQRTVNLAAPSRSMSVTSTIANSRMLPALRSRPAALKLAATWTSPLVTAGSSCSIDTSSLVAAEAEAAETKNGKLLEITLVVQPYCLIKAFKKQIAKNKSLRYLLDSA